MNALDPLQISSLCEIGNIGAGHAATALSQLVNCRIRITVPSVQVVAPGKFLESFFGNAPLVGTHLKILGDISGGILFAFTEDNALKLVDLVVGHSGATSVAEMEESVLKETGSILSASYLNALGRMMDLKLIPSVPRFLSGSCENVLASAFGEQLRGSKGVIGIESVFVEASTAMKAHFFLLPEAMGLHLLLGRGMVSVRKEGFDYAANSI